MHGNFLQSVFFSEFVHTSAGVDKFLFARKERMAYGANFDPQVFFDGTGLKRVAACTGYRSHLIFRMDSLFHGFAHLFPPWNNGRFQSKLDT